MKKLVGSLVGLSLLAMPVVSMAQTTTNAQIQAMLTQIQTLQTQIQALKAAQAQVASTSASVSGTLKLLRNLRQGMTGEDVKALQAILAADPSLYPEGLVTGFYGALTAKAVMKFQQKHGFEQVGFVGPKTLKKLNEAFDELGLRFEISSTSASSTTIVVTGNANGNDKGTKLCIPPGHMHAKGWLKKNDKPVPTSLIPLCNEKGKGGNNNPGTTTPDTIAPIISGIVSAPSQNSGTVYFTTNELATTKVYYATTSVIDVNATSTLSLSNNSLVLNHGITIPGLNASTTYYFVVESKDATGNKTVSGVNSFVTTAAPDTTAPVISAIGTLNLMGTTTSIAWTTNEAATSKVWFGTTNPLNLASSTVVSNNSLVSTHALGLSGLATSTTYYYVVVSADASGNVATSSQGSFLTTAGI